MRINWLSGVLFFWAVLVSAQQLPVPNLHLPVPSEGASVSAQSSGQSASVSQAPSNMPSVKLSARIEPVKVYESEGFDYVLELSWEKNKESCELEFKLPIVPSGEKLKAVGSEFASENLARGEMEQVRRIYRFKYFPEEHGKLSISQADFEYRCRGTEQWFKVSAPAFPVEVGKKRIHLDAIFQSVYFRISLLVILLGAIVLAVVLWLRSRRRESKLEVGPERSAEEKALELLKSADQYRIAGRYGDYFLGLEQALRNYLEEKYSVRWSGREKLVEEVSKLTASELGLELDYFLKLSDRVKFAGYEPASSELDRGYQAVRRVIEFKKIDMAEAKKD